MSALKVHKTLQIDTDFVLGGFEDYYSNLTGKRFKKLRRPPKKFTLNAVFQHCKGIIQNDSFNLATVSENTVLTILKNNNVSKVAGLDNLSGRFIMSDVFMFLTSDGAEVLAKPMTDL